jgi:hypothetical protein
MEAGLRDAQVASAVLRTLKDQCDNQILAAWPQDYPLLSLMRSLSSQTVPGSQWLIRIPDMLRFLNIIRPVLEQRLARSPWRGLSAQLTINLYREAYRLQFEEGRLADLRSLGFIDYSMGADGGDLCIPPDAFVRLVSGHCELQELFDAWPDIVVRPQVRGMIDCLFPRLKAFLHSPYHYLGPLNHRHEADAAR